MIEPGHEQFLRVALEADRTGHSGRTLFDHLKGTHELLELWGAPEHVRLAGLFHSIYGTNAFKHQSLKMTGGNRDIVRQLIGDRAEFLAYVFCVTDRPKAFVMAANAIAVGNVNATVINRIDGSTIVLTAEDVGDLMDVEAANLMEQKASIPTLMKIAASPGLRHATFRAMWLGVRDQKEAAAAASSLTAPAGPPDA